MALNPPEDSQQNQVDSHDSFTPDYKIMWFVVGDDKYTRVSKSTLNIGTAWVTPEIDTSGVGCSSSLSLTRVRSESSMFESLPQLSHDS